MLATHGTVAVDGAQIYYETRGAGTPLLVIQGGLSEAGATEQLADALAGQHQVITYDRRGLSRSEVSAPEPPVTIARHADDAAAVLGAVTSEPALVVGASIGALIGLHLAVRHPEQVATLVAHEPPMTAVVHDPQREAAMDAIEELAKDDVIAAIQRMAALTGADREPTEDGARPGAAAGDLEANLRRFFSHDFGAVRSSTLDAKDLAGIADTRVVLTGGSESTDGWEHRCARLLAEQAQRPFIEVPGGHGNLVSHPWATAEALRRIVGEVG